jgi:hypothetical protein
MLASELLHHEGTKDTKVMKTDHDLEVRLPGNEQTTRTGVLRDLRVLRAFVVK